MRELRAAERILPNDDDERESNVGGITLILQLRVRDGESRESDAESRHVTVSMCYSLALSSANKRRVTFSLALALVNVSLVDVLISADLISRGGGGGGRETET